MMSAHLKTRTRSSAASALKYLSVCSGIEAASVAWEPLGWQPAAFAEIEKFPSAVLAHRWPDTPNLGDLTKHDDWPTLRPDLIVGGTPCQAFSVAGLRKGLADPRGNLTLTFLSLLKRELPRWVVWENVPGVLSDKTGAFGAFLGGLGELGYGFAYRVLDAQNFGVPQRRRRVFVVGYLGDWRRAAAVLFERESLCGNTAPRREAREEVAPTLSARTRGGGGLGTDFEVGGGLIPDTAHTLRGEGFDASEDGTGRGTPLIPQTCGTICADSHPGSYTGQDAYTGRLIPTAFDWQGSGKQTTLVASTEGTGALGTTKTPAIAFSCKDHGADAGGQSPTLRSMGHNGSHANGGGQVAIAFDYFNLSTGDMAETLKAGDGTGSRNHTASASAVRRLTPTECERLQGFPDGHTLIPWRGKEPEACPDGPRYKALGNSMAVPVMRWIGERIAHLEQEASE